MVKLNDSSLIHFAQDLTKIALEHGFIPNMIDDDYMDSSEGKAKCVSTFYKTLLDTLNSEE